MMAVAFMSWRVTSARFFNAKTMSHRAIETRARAMGCGEHTIMHCTCVQQNVATRHAMLCEGYRSACEKHTLLSQCYERLCSLGMDESSGAIMDQTSVQTPGNQTLPATGGGVTQRARQGSQCRALPDGL